MRRFQIHTESTYRVMSGISSIADEGISRVNLVCAKEAARQAASGFNRYVYVVSVSSLTKNSQIRLRSSSTGFVARAQYPIIQS